MKSHSPGWGYRLLALLLYPFWLLHALKHGRQHNVGAYRSMRMAAPIRDDKPRIWVHAASVGEVRAVTPLVQTLMERGDSILFTSFTASGYRAIQQQFDDSVYSCVIPIDCYWHCRRFYRDHDIRLGLIVETELWPELLSQAHDHGIGLILVNARLSGKSLHRCRWVRRLLGRILALFSQILARNDGDREALLALGASPDRIEVIGNLKAQASSPQISERLLEREYLLLASSHADEEIEFLRARPTALRDRLLVIAPRHPQRSAALQQQIKALGMRYSVRSLAQPVDQQTEVYLADTLGELADFMAHASVVIMGGSFDDTGGHNLIEPASLGCAIITGPSDSNISADIEMLGVGQGVLQVENMDACWSAVQTLLHDPDHARALGREARARLARQPDVLRAYVDAIAKHL